MPVATDTKHKQNRYVTSTLAATVLRDVFISAAYLQSETIQREYYICQALNQLLFRKRESQKKKS